MRRFPPAFVVSVLLHGGLLWLLLWSWAGAPRPLVVMSVPVELVAKIPSREQAEAPVDKLAVKTPQPIPAPEEQPKPVPPTPAPPMPIPTPQKAITPKKEPEPKPPEPKLEPKPAPKAADKAPPDKNGMKKPAPLDKAKPAPAAPSLDLNALSQLAAAPSKASTRAQAQANTHRTTGASNFGSGPADAGAVNDSLAALIKKLGKIWAPNCDVPGGNTVDLHLMFVISPSGRVISGPQWTNPRSDPVWVAAATRAKAAVKRGELYDDLPAGLYNRPLDIEFDAHKVCSGE